MLPLFYGAFLDLRHKNRPHVPFISYILKLSEKSTSCCGLGWWVQPIRIAGPPCICRAELTTNDGWVATYLKGKIVTLLLQLLFLDQICPYTIVMLHNTMR